MQCHGSKSPLYSSGEIRVNINGLSGGSSWLCSRGQRNSTVILVNLFIKLRKLDLCQVMRYFLQ